MFNTAVAFGNDIVSTSVEALNSVLGNVVITKCMAKRCWNVFSKACRFRIDGCRYCPRSQKWCCQDEYWNGHSVGLLDGLRAVGHEHLPYLQGQIGNLTGTVKLGSVVQGVGGLKSAAGASPFKSYISSWI